MNRRPVASELGSESGGLPVVELPLLAQVFSASRSSLVWSSWHEVVEILHLKVNVVRPFSLQSRRRRVPRVCGTECARIR